MFAQDPQTGLTVVSPRVYRLRQQQAREGGINVAELRLEQRGLAPITYMHHVSKIIEGNAESYRVRICRTCSGLPNLLELGSYADVESALLVNDSHELLQNRLNQLHLLCAEDLKYINTLEVRRRGSTNDWLISDILNARLSKKLAAGSAAAGESKSSTTAENGKEKKSKKTKREDDKFSSSSSSSRIATMGEVIGQHEGTSKRSGASSGARGKDNGRINAAAAAASIPFGHQEKYSLSDKHKSASINDMKHLGSAVHPIPMSVPSSSLDKLSAAAAASGGGGGVESKASTRPITQALSRVARLTDQFRTNLSNYHTVYLQWGFFVHTEDIDTLATSLVDFVAAELSLLVSSASQRRYGTRVNATTDTTSSSMAQVELKFREAWKVGKAPRSLLLATVASLFPGNAVEMSTITRRISAVLPQDNPQISRFRELSKNATDEVQLLDEGMEIRMGQLDEGTPVADLPSLFAVLKDSNDFLKHCYSSAAYFDYIMRLCTWDGELHGMYPSYFFFHI